MSNIQVAKWYYENDGISLAAEEFGFDVNKGHEVSEETKDKNRNIQYDALLGILQQFVSKSKNWVVCNWKDKPFQKQVISL